MKQLVLGLPENEYVLLSNLRNGLPHNHYILVWNNYIYKLVTNHEQKFQFSQIVDGSGYCSMFKAHINYKDAFNEVFLNEFADEMKIYEFENIIEMYKFILKVVTVEKL